MSSIKRDITVLSECLCDNFLYGFKGGLAPAAALRAFVADVA